jgi:GH25 family lysozyme M1 (1,4-beta-N-acetylmuramidase)
MSTPQQDYNPAERNYAYPIPRLAAWWGRVKQAITPQPYVLGCDLSHWNASVDFKALKAAGYEFAILKATEQTSYIDPTFVTRWQQCLDAGMIPGSYHFFRSNFDGVNQADFHLEVTRPMRELAGGHCIPPANDVETADGATVAARRTRITHWHDRMREVLKSDTLCYSSQYMWQTLTNNMPLKCWAWAAHWTSAETYLWPYGWPVEMRRFVQFGVYPRHSWVPPVPGCTGEVDVNKWLGTLDELRAFVGLTELTDKEKLDRLWVGHPDLHP